MKKIFFILLSISILSCNSDDDSNSDVILYADYQNPQGGVPSLTINEGKSSKKINIESNPQIDYNGDRILFKYPAVTFKTGKTVYSINSNEIVTERKQGKKWINDDENFLSSTFSKSLDIVLVLDVSSSLDENINVIKSDAVSMISNILSNNQYARIAVVKFSRGNTYIDLTSNLNELSNFINQNSDFTDPNTGNTYQLEGKDETGLYEAINTAITLLNESTSNGKGILTFTDGVSNFQFNPSYQSSSPIVNSLKNSNIASYTIGFIGNQGGVDKEALKEIAINGNYSFPKNTDDLNKVFTRFSNNIAAVYDLIYDTNNAPFNSKLEYRFRFKLKKVN